MMGIKQVKRGFALEGGGAKGAYQMGVFKAYIESGHEIHGVVGTSIGAVNAAMIASNELEQAVELWETISFEHLFEQEFIDAMKIDNNFPGNITTALRKFISERGINQMKMREYLETYVDEAKIRASRIDFGLVTLSISERKPYEVFLRDIPEGKLIDYILASAKLPIFSPHNIDDNRFLDGGFINNCPINMLIDDGYDEIIAVRTKGFGVYRRFDKDANVTIIQPNENLGHFFDFTADTAKTNIKRGYCDGLKIFQGLAGKHYYLQNVDIVVVVTNLFAISDEDLGRIDYFSKEIYQNKRVLFERVIPEIAEYLKLPRNFTYEQFVLGVLEFVALKKEIPRFEVYNFDEFCKLIKNTPMPKTENLLTKVGIDFYEKRATFVEEIVKLLV